MSTHQRQQQEWLENTDTETVRSVFNILPDVFKKRVESGLFDRRLLEGVEGGDYVVPLCFVTKAWDVLLKGEIGDNAFRIGPEEDDEDDYELALAQFMAEERATRTRAQATADNDTMKRLWQELLETDIDALQIDFTQYNMHLPPQVSGREFYDYFITPIDGVEKWIMTPVNHPDVRCIFSSVSKLMEFTAMTELQRSGELDRFTACYD